jgi:hypothetical protein
MRRLIIPFLMAVFLTACSSPAGLAPTDRTPPPQIATNPGASTQSEATPIPAAPVSTLEGQADTFRLPLNPDLPPFDFKLIANPSPQRLIDGSNLVGWIEVAQQGSSLDRILVAFHDASQNLSWSQLELRALDINSDGYLDIASIEHGGAEWGFLHWYEFDPEQRRFIVSSLADELSAIQNKGVAVDLQRREIYVYSLVATCASTYVYVNAQGHLVLKQKQEYKPSDQGCVLVP